MRKEEPSRVQRKLPVEFTSKERETSIVVFEDGGWMGKSGTVEVRASLAQTLSLMGQHLVVGSAVVLAFS